MLESLLHEVARDVTFYMFEVFIARFNMMMNDKPPFYLFYMGRKGSSRNKILINIKV